MFLLLFIVLILLNTSTASAQEAPPDPESSVVQKAQGASFKQGWNYFTLGFNECTVENVLNELQADGGSALKAETIYLKELFSWKPYSFLNNDARKKKISGNQIIAFNSNQKFYLEMDQKACLFPDQKRQEQIDIVRQGISEKSSLVEKVRDLPNDLWTKLVELLNTNNYPSPTSEVSGDKILEDLTFGGKTVVKDLGITGKISSGLLAIEGLSDSQTATINTLSNDLYIQNEGIGGVNFLSGKVTIDRNGNLKVTKLMVDTSQSSSSSLGSGTISAGNTVLDVQTSAVTQVSKVFITATSETGGQALVVKSKTKGVGFRVVVEKPHASNITFDWFIIN